MSEFGYLLRALLGNPDRDLQNAQSRAEADSYNSQHKYNVWHQKTGRIPVDYDDVRGIRSGYRVGALRNRPVNYNDPADVWRAHKDLMDYARIVGAEAYSNEKAYRNKEIAPRDKATMGAPIEPKKPESHNIPTIQTKTASEEHTMITYTQAYQAKQASLQKKATLIGRGINSLFGADTWMGRTFGESPETAAENFFRDDEAAAKRKEQAAQYDAQQAAMQARIDAGLAAAQKRLAEGKGLTQQSGYKAPTAVAKTQAKPKVQAVPPPPKKQMSGQEAFQQRSRGIRTKENDRAMRTADAAIRRKDGAGGRR